MPKSIAGTTLLVYEEGTTGLILKATITGSGSTPPTTESLFEVGAEVINVGDGITYRNSGTTAAPVWENTSLVLFSEISIGSEARTATAAGLTTGAITAPTAFRTFVTVTSAAATDQIALPAITSAGIGQEIWITVGANGYELITPASSNNTINQVDSDGTNQMDVAANTTVRCTQVSATGWIAETIAATTIAITAPDND